MEQQLHKPHRKSKDRKDKKDKKEHTGGTWPYTLRAFPGQNAC